MSAPTGPKVSPHFPVLDTLRAVGALGVLTTHTMFWSGDYLGNGWIGTLWARLDVGVALFFVLSGFLLSRPWFARRELGLAPPRTRRYLWKRFLRIYPAYAVVAVISLALLTDNEDASATDWMVTLLLADIYVHEELPAGLTQVWSLSTEVAFYLVLPAAMALLAGKQAGPWRPARVVAALGLGSAVSVWWLLSGAWFPVLIDNAMPLQWLPSYVLWFAAGITLALVHVLASRHSPSPATARAHTLLRALGSAPGACWTSALGLLLISSTPVAGPALLAAPTPTELLTKIVLYAAIAVLVVTPAVFGDPASGYLRFMSLPLPRHLGLTSYSLFLIHLPVLHLVMWWRDLPLFGGNGFQIWGLTLILSLVAAELLYRLVERPAMRLRRLVAGDPRTATTPTTASTVR